MSSAPSARPHDRCRRIFQSTNHPSSVIAAEARTPRNAAPAHVQALGRRHFHAESGMRGIKAPHSPESPGTGRAGASESGWRPTAPLQRPEQWSRCWRRSLREMAGAAASALLALRAVHPQARWPRMEGGRPDCSSRPRSPSRRRPRRLRPPGLPPRARGGAAVGRSRPPVQVQRDPRAVSSASASRSSSSGTSSRAASSCTGPPRAPRRMTWLRPGLHGAPRASGGDGISR